MTHTATTPAASNNVDGYSVGQTLTVTCEAPAHGGAFVARTEQGVIFVRHGIVGEQAEVRITAIGPKPLLLRRRHLRTRTLPGAPPPPLDPGGCARHRRGTRRSNRRTQTARRHGIRPHQPG